MSCDTKQQQEQQQCPWAIIGMKILALVVTTMQECNYNHVNHDGLKRGFMRVHLDNGIWCGCLHSLKEIGMEGEWWRKLWTFDNRMIPVLVFVGFPQDIIPIEWTIVNLIFMLCLFVRGVVFVREVFSQGSSNFLVSDNMLVVRLHAFMLLGSFALAIDDMANLEKVDKIFEKHCLMIFFCCTNIL